MDYFRTAPAAELVTKTTVKKGHGRIETRTYTTPNVVECIVSERSYPGQSRFTTVKTLVKVDTRSEHADGAAGETRTYISSAPRDIERIARGIRGHWGVESRHWLLDVEFKDDLARYRTGYGAKNMPSSAASPSVSSAPTPPRAASRYAASPQAVARNFS